MPIEAIAATEAVVSRERLRTFHLTGPAPEDEIPEGALRPSALEPFTSLPAIEACYPMCVRPDGGAQPFRELAGSLEHAGNITSVFHAALQGKTFEPLEDAAPDAIESLKECSPAEIARLRKLLPPGAFLVACHPDSLILLHAAALAEARRGQRTRFWERVLQTSARLRQMLLLDRTHAPGAISAESVSASLGSRVGAFFNPGSIAKALQRPANPLRCMEPERRSRCETTLAMLEEALHDAANEPAFWMFHAGKMCIDIAEFRGAEKCFDDSFAAALEFCNDRLDRLTHLLRAVRVARLEIDSAFNPAIHEEMLARFDWQSASAEELLAIPPIVVLETADRLAQVSLTSFGTLLRSGRPVQVLITRAGLEPQDFGYLAIAHRESFVLQSSMAQPSHLLAGLAAMAKSQRPAVAVVSVTGEESWLAESVLVVSRAFPLYSYNPDAGPRWSQRFRLFIPPPADLSAAHAAAVTANLQRHFRMIPASAWNSEQMELNEYLAAYQSKPPLAIPYIWVEGSNGVRHRALLTRDLANYCVDRRRAWDLFEELSGIGRPQLVPNDGAREEGAREALQQVIAMLSSKSGS